MAKPLQRSFILGLACVVLCAGPALGWEEPYAFKKKERRFTKEPILQVNFESSIPPNCMLEGGSIEPELGVKGSHCLVSEGKKGTIVEFKCDPIGLSMSRFDVELQYTGEDFGGFHIEVLGWDRDDNLFYRKNIGGEWGYLGPKSWRHWEKTADVEIEKLHRVGLRIVQFSRDGYVYIDNLKLLRYTNAHPVPGQFVRSQLERGLKREGATAISDLTGVKVAMFDDRDSFFNIASIDPGRRYLLSVWRQRLHLGTTYKKQNRKFKRYVLGVRARADDIRAAAKRHGKGAKFNDKVKDMLQRLVDDVAEHGFNTIWTDDQKKLRTLAGLAAEKKIDILYNHPKYNEVGSFISRRDGKMPKKMLDSIQADLKKLAGVQKKYKNVIGWQIYPHVPYQYRGYPPYAANLAKVRKFIRDEIKKAEYPDIPLTEVYDHVQARQIQAPYSDFGIRNTWRYAYGDKRSGTYGPNYWAHWSDFGWRRYAEYAMMARGMNFIWWAPVSRQYEKSAINKKRGWVDPGQCGWVWNEKKKRWSGWTYCRPVPGQIRAFMWNAAAAGASGVFLEGWGPGAVPADLTLKDLESAKYADGVYRPEPLRHMDMTESIVWREAGRAAKEIAPFSKLLADLTSFGAKGVSTNKRWVTARKLCFYNGFSRFLAIANNYVTTAKVGDYDSSKNLRIDKNTGQWAYMAKGGGKSARRGHGEGDGRPKSRARRSRDRAREPAEDTGMVDAGGGGGRRRRDGTRTETAVERARRERGASERQYATGVTPFILTVKGVRTGWSLWDCRTGQKLDGTPVQGKQDISTFEMAMTPGQGAVYFMGTLQMFERVVKKRYGLGQEAVE